MQSIKNCIFSVKRVCNEDGKRKWKDVYKWVRLIQKYDLSEVKSKKDVFQLKINGKICSD